jgi:hypothetical protein
VYQSGPDRTKPPLEFDPDELVARRVGRDPLQGTGVAPDEKGYASGIGASNLDEALKVVISGFDLGHLDPRGESSDAQHTPDWVASTHDGLATALADYYSCEKRNIAEVF